MAKVHGTRITAEPGKQEILITREFDAPRETVFKAWTDCEHLMRWWGPKDFTTPFCKIDLRPEGVFHYCMRSPQGQDFCGKSVYREIVESERIIYTDFFVDQKGNPVPATYYGLSPDWPQETLVTVTFAEDRGKTNLTVQHSVGSAPASERDMCEQGWAEMLEKLEGNLAKA
ncbi:MAG: SRPBCC domain-containing protein [Thermodesulfobacteriota bacterium]